ncbi:hypothetical protein Lser_V15G15007 [Lactuca serriola]
MVIGEVCIGLFAIRDIKIMIHILGFTHPGLTHPVRAHFLEDYGQEKLWKTPPVVQEVFHEEEEPEIGDTNTPTITGVKVEIPASFAVPINIKQEVFKAEKEVDMVQESTSLPAEPSTGIKSVKPKIKGVSTIELFTPEAKQK